MSLKSSAFSLIFFFYLAIFADVKENVFMLPG